jgi:hypothetical protein
MVVAVCAAGILILKVHLDQLDVDMQTRQAIIYDFMLSLASNPAIHADWLAHDPDAYDYSEFIYDRAVNLVNKYLESLG